MACSLPHTDSGVEALVQRLINEDKGRQDVLLNLAFQFEDSCAVRGDLRKAYEKCNDISQESRALICTFLKESSEKDRKLHLSIGIGCLLSQANCPLTEKDLHQLRMDEEALKEMLEEEAMNKKAQEEKIRQEQDENDAFFLEFGVVSGGWLLFGECSTGRRLPVPRCNTRAYCATHYCGDWRGSLLEEVAFAGNTGRNSGLVVPVFQKGDDPIEAINHMMSFLTAVVISRYPTTNNQLRTSSNPRQQATIYDRKVEGIERRGGKGRRRTVIYVTRVLRAGRASGLAWDSVGGGESGSRSSRTMMAKYLLYRSTWKTREGSISIVADESRRSPIGKRLRSHRLTPSLLRFVADVAKYVRLPEKLEREAVEQHRLESRTFEVKMKEQVGVRSWSVNKVVETVKGSVKAQSQAKDTVIVKLKEQIKSLKGNVDDSKVKMDMDEIETLNIELEHREQGLVIAALKNELRKLKGKAVDKEAIETHSVDPNVSKENMEPITPKLLNKRTAHSSYIKHTQEEALVLRDIDLLSHISRSCPSINNFGPQLVEVTPRKKDKKVRFAESLTSTENTKPDSTSNIVSNKRVLHSTGVRLSTSASGSQPSGNTRNDRIQQTPINGSASVQNSKKQDNSDYVCITSDDCMSSDNLCVSNSMNDVKFRAKPKKSKSKKDIWKPTGKVFTQIGYIWRPTGRTFTIVGNACPLTRITTTNEVPSRKPIVLKSESPKPVVKLVYSRKPRKNKNTESVSKTKVVQIVLWYLDSGCSKHMTEDRSQLTNFISKFLGTVKFGNDQVAKIIGYETTDWNVTISRKKFKETPYTHLKIPINEKLYLLHMDSVWANASRGASNGKKYILDLREYYEKVGISHETSVARSPQQNGIVER
ncbi:retrovirus-related pol polyprotein from transposon TNT 1-94 [Tanacetum coccineum]